MNFSAGLSLVIAMLPAVVSADGLRAREEQKLASEIQGVIDAVPDEAARRVVNKLSSGSAIPDMGVAEAKRGDVCRLVRYLSDTKIDRELPVSQVLGKGSLLVLDFSAWIEGVSTSDVADESLVDFRSHLFECRGTRKYDTIVGSRTVKHFVLVDQAKITPILKEVQRLQSFRIWLDRDEKHATRAKFMGFEKGKVLLQNADGAKVGIKIGELSKADQKWVKDAVK